jgi:hypothetical protein
MASLSNFDVTPVMLRQYMNPSLDPNGVQIGPLFTLEDVDVSGAFGTNDIVLDLSSIGRVGRNQLQGYRFYVNDIMTTAYGIIQNGESDSNGNVQLIVDQALPNDGTWQIICESSRVDYSTTDAVQEINGAALRVRAALSSSYEKMLSYIVGLLLWPREVGGFDSAAMDISSITLPFYEATAYHIWLNPIYNYEAMQIVRCDADITDKFAITSDDDTKVSTLTTVDGYTPAKGSVIAMDFRHTLDPVPYTLQHAVLEFAKARLTMRNSNIGKDQMDAMRASMQTAIEDIASIPEFDELNLYRATKANTQSGYGSINVMRG